jgi:hypothetical protein
MGKKEPGAAPICASKFYRFVPYRDSTQTMVFTFFFVTDRESTQKRIHKVLLEKENRRRGVGGKCRKTKQTKHKELFQDLLKPKLTKNTNKKETITTIAAGRGRGGGGRRAQKTNRREHPRPPPRTKAHEELSAMKTKTTRRERC